MSDYAGKVELSFAEYKPLFHELAALGESSFCRDCCDVSCVAGYSMGVADVLFQALAINTERLFSACVRASAQSRADQQGKFSAQKSGAVFVQELRFIEMVGAGGPVVALAGQRNHESGKAGVL